MKISEMRFPVLRINESNVRRFDHPRELSTLTKQFLDQGGFKEVTHFIDSHARSFAVESVKKLRRSRNPLYWFAPSPIQVVEIEIGCPTQLEFDEVKRLVADLIIRKGWYRQGGESRDEFHKGFAAITNLDDLMKNISAYGSWQG